jgi:hypothetical protein
MERVSFMDFTNFVKGAKAPRSPSTTMWSQLRDISIRIDEDAERGTPLNFGK